MQNLNNFYIERATVQKYKKNKKIIFLSMFLPLILAVIPPILFWSIPLYYLLTVCGAFIFGSYMLFNNWLNKRLAIAKALYRYCFNEEIYSLKRFKIYKFKVYYILKNVKIKNVNDKGIILCFRDKGNFDYATEKGRYVKNERLVNIK